MKDSILEILAKRAPRKTRDEDARLNREVQKFVSRIKSKVGKSKSIKSARGGLQSMGARGVLVKENNLYSRKVIVKASYILSSNKNFRTRIRHHLNYAGQNKLDTEKNAPELYGRDDKAINIKSKVNDFESAPYIFNIIISPEDGEKLELKEFTRDFISVVEKDLKAKIDWVAGNHYDTNDPHVHVLIKGMDGNGNPLLMKRDYISNGLRSRASQVVNKKLGLKSYEEVVDSLNLKVSSTKKCEIDTIIAQHKVEGCLDLAKISSEDLNELPHSLFARRLEFLETKGLAHKTDEHRWRVNDSFREELRNIDRASSIITKLSGSIKIDKQDCEVISAKHATERIIKGHVVERGSVEGHNAKEYLLIKSKEKKFVYVELEKYSEKVPAQVGEFVRIEATKPFTGALTSDHTIDKVAQENSGIYDAVEHAKRSENSVVLPPGISAAEFAQVHVKRLELLARKGLVEKTAEGKFSVPKDYLDKIAVEAKKSHEGYQPHIKVVRLSPARLKGSSLGRGLSR